MKARLQYVLHGGVLNTLYDVRDAITAKNVPDEERQKYCKARLTYDMKAHANIEPGTSAV
jgi:hypothetical protein